MGNTAGTVGLLKAILTADTSNFDAGMKKAATGPQAVEKSVSKLGAEVQKITPQAERMVKALGGDKLLYTANNLATAINKVGGATRLTEAEQTKANRTLTEAISKYQRIGIEAPKSLLDAERATRRLTPSVSLADKAVGSLRSNFGSLLGAFAVGNIAAQAVSGLVGMAKAAVQNAGALVDMSGKTGLSIEGLQRMQFVAEQTGTSIETFTTAAFALGVNVAKGSKEAKDAVQDLGLSYEQLKTQRPDQQFETIAAALQKVQNEQARNQMAVALFGKTAKDVLPAIAEGYSDIARQATVAGDAQIRALDRYSDRAGQFYRNSITNVTAFIGKQLVLSDALAEVTEEFRRQGKAVDQVHQNEIMLEAMRRAELGLVGQRQRSDVDLPRSGGFTKIAESYASQLRKVREELKSLTAADRAEIAAAQQLGTVTGEELALQFNISEAALRLLTAEMKEASKTAKALTGDYTALEKAFDAADRRVELGAAVLSQDMLRQGITKPTPAQLFSDQQNRLGELPKTDLRAWAGADFGLKVPTVAKSGGAMTAIVDRWRTEWQDLQIDMVGSFSDGISRMLTGLRGFKESFLDIWGSIRQSFANVISGLVQNFIGGYLGKLTGAIGIGAGSAAVAGGVAGTAIGGGAAAATAAGGTAVAGGAAAGGGIGATIAGLATNPFTIAAAGGLLLGLGIWKGGLFRGGFEGTEGNKRRDRYLSQFGDPSNKGVGGAGHNLASMLTGFGAGSGGGRLFSALQSADSDSELVNAQRSINSFLGVHGKRGLKAFNLGGFVPPGVNQPAMLHGGSMGEIIAPVEKLMQAASPRTNIFQFEIHALDGADVDRVVRGQVIPRLKRALQLNQDDYLGHTKRVLG